MAEGFDKSNGKFTSSLGNVALVDCHSLGTKTAWNLFKLADDFDKTIYSFVSREIRKYANQVNTTNFCQYGMTIEGVLKKSIDYYTIDSSIDMKNEIIKRGRDVMERLSLNTNATITTPMLDSI